MHSFPRLSSYALYLKTLAAALAAALLCAQAAAQQGQTAARPDRGTNPGGAYSVSDVENVSLQNGNVGLSIPLASLPPMAGGRLSLTLRAHYNSKLWNVVREEEEAGFPAQRYVVDQPQLNDGGGWRVDASYHVDFREARADFDYEGPTAAEANTSEAQRLTQHNWYKVVVRTPDGAEHELRPSGSGFQTYGGIDYPRTYMWGFHTARPTAGGGPFRYDTTDGTFISAVVNPPGHASGVYWTLFLPDGTQVIQYFDGIQRIRDTNGNSIKIFTDGAGTHYQDEHLPGREIRVEDVPGGAGGHLLKRVWYRTAGGVLQHVDVNYGETVVRGKVYKVSDWNSIAGSVCQRQVALGAQTLSVVREIVFPQTEPDKDARRFTFSYNSDQTEAATTQQFYYACGVAPEVYTREASRGLGALSRMVTPTGAKVDYTYTLASTHDFTGLVGTDRLTRETIATKELKYTDLAGAETAEEWIYSIPYDSVGASSTVTNPGGSTSTIGYYQRHPDFPRGVGTGDLLAGQVFVTGDGLTVTHKRWAMRGTAFATGTDGFTAADPYVEAEYTSLLENGVAVKMSAKVYEHDFNGNVTKVTEYDWFDPASVQREQGTGIPTGVPAGATVLRVTDTSYHNQAADASPPNYYRQRTLTPCAELPCAVSILNAVKETSTGASRTRFSYDGQPYGLAPMAGNVTKAGNVTQVSRRDDKGDADAGNDTEVTTSTTYGDYGNPSTTTDPNGNVTHYTYGDDTHALPTKVEVNPLNGTGVQATLKTYDEWTGLVTSATDPNGQVTTVDYGNQLLGTVDPFGRPGMTRSPAGTSPAGATLYRKAYTVYDDAERRVRTESDLYAEGDLLLKSRATHDELGRVLLAEQNEGGTSYTISARTVYAEAGRVTLQSAPARGTTLQTWKPEGWTRVTKDAYGRVVEAATFGGDAQPSPTPLADTIPNWTGSVTTAYRANETTVTDQAGRKRRSVTDALGRLLRVDEPDKDTGALDANGSPVQPTSYAYDALGNLRRVEQGGQLRFFLYDSLGRLVRAKNPEQGDLAADGDFPARSGGAFGNPGGHWSTGYLYDPGGNLSKRKDARGVTATYLYDGLNRNTTTAYAGSGAAPTPSVTRTYDGAPRGKGRPWKTETAQTGLTTVEEYDAAGRPLRQSQKFWTGAWGTPFEVGYSYDLAGNLRTQTYPSNHSVSYTYDNAGRLSTFAGNLGEGGAARTYADTFDYDGAGRRRQERYGTDTPVFNKHLFNSRGQLAEVRVSTHGLSSPGQETNWNRGAIINHYSDSGWGATGGGSDNNGNLKKQDVYIPNDDAISGHSLTTSYYDYDALNRLRWVKEGRNGADLWRQQYEYDRWGNRTVNAEATQVFDPNALYAIPEPQFSVDAGTNRLGVPAGQAGLMDYDAAGNLTSDTYQGGQGGGGTRDYDAENRMTSAQFLAGQTQTAAYAYDADGRRVKRMVGTSAEVWQVYGAGGELLAEYAPDGSPAAPRKEYGYRSGELLVTAAPGAASLTQAQRVNVAAAANGATAGASSSYASLGLTPDRAINGSRTSSGSYWNDGASSSGAFPDDLEVTFSGQKTIDEVDLFFHQDGNGAAEPTEGMTFTQYGVTSFEVQYWTGAAWAGVPNGVVTGNNKVWRKVAFPALTTSKIRVRVNASSDVWSRVVEVEAYEAPKNVAAAANGATATASSSYAAYGLTPEKAINGSRTSAGGYWNDSTSGVFTTASSEEYLQINFSGAKTINEVDVFCLQDNVGAAEPTEAMTFTQYGLTSFEVQYRQGAQWVTVPGGGVTGNNKVWRKFAFAPVTTDAVRVLVHGSADMWSRVVEVEAYEAQRTNHAASANGGVAAASSTYSPAFPLASVNNGERRGAGWNGGQGGWNDATADAYPDWVEVSFAGARQIDEVDVLTVQDAITSPSEPTEAMTFALYGLTAYDVQYWTGSQWATVPGGGVTGNNKVWRKVTFPAVTTTKVRVVINASLASYSRLVEVEAWGPGEGGSRGVDLRWLVSDQLGTPRMVVDKTGSLAEVSRHDYFPFGEEVGAGVGGRTTGQGYSQIDNVRQKFTGYEQDVETRLNYAQARYHSPIQGRFTSPDPLLASSATSLPQSWNRYTYALNSPLIIVDPNGLVWAYTTSNEGRTKTYVWYENPKDVPAGATKLEKTSDFTVTGQINGVNVVVRLNPAGPYSATTKFVMASTALKFMLKGGDYHVKGYEITPTDSPYKVNGRWAGGVETDWGVQLGATGLFTAGLSASSAGAHRALYGPSAGRYFFTDGLEATATAAARAEGGRTLNMVPAGRAAMWLDGKVPDLISTQIWRWESRQWSRGASGNVPFFSRGLPSNPVSTFVRDELPNLYRNPNVQTLRPRTGP